MDEGVVALGIVKLIREPAKPRETATKLGAHEFYATKGLEEFKYVAPIDHLIVTSNMQIP